jgi:hypothetical protein
MKTWLTPSGAAVMGVCFFLPWAKFSCTGLRAEVTGADLGGALWLIPAMAAVILAACFVLRRMGMNRAASWINLIAVVITLTALVWKLISILTSPQPAFGLIKPEHVGFRIGIGAIGTVVGLVGVLIGSRFIRRTASDEITNRDIICSEPDERQP